MRKLIAALLPASFYFCSGRIDAEKHYDLRG